MTYLTTIQLALKIKYDERTLRERLNQASTADCHDADPS
jgi:hypothetical protein